MHATWVVPVSPRRDGQETESGFTNIDHWGPCGAKRRPTFGSLYRVKAYRSVTVRTQLPAELAPLGELANNLRWSWDDRARRLFRWVEPQLWEQVRRDPVRLLASVPVSRLEELAADPSFMAFLDEMSDDLHRYLDSPGWLQLRGDTPLKAVAYFSPEFGNWLFAPTLLS